MKPLMEATQLDERLADVDWNRSHARIDTYVPLDEHGVEHYRVVVTLVAYSGVVHSEYNTHPLDTREEAELYLAQLTGGVC